MHVFHTEDFLFMLILLRFFAVMADLTTEKWQEACRKEADVVFVVDSSSNLLYEEFKMYILETIADIIRNLDVDSGRIRVAAVQFAEAVEVQFFYTDYKIMGFTQQS